MKIKLVNENSRRPARSTRGAIGYDCHLRIPQMGAVTVTIQPGGRYLAPLGFSIELKDGYAGFILPRSGAALNHGLTVLNSPGLIDPDYRGEVHALLYNAGQNPVELRDGERVAQLVITSCYTEPLEPVEQLSHSLRGVGGFGSTGRA